jgi:hypothetical protein
MDKFVRSAFAIGIVVLLTSMALTAATEQTPERLKTRNVVLIVLDGVRWQEVFTGADPTLLNSEHGGVSVDLNTFRKEFWRDDVTDRRQVLFPFLWGVVARQGQIFGNQAKGSVARITNDKAFSYPGYNEMLIGHPDSRIDSNEYGPNPNITVFEWLNSNPELHGRVAVFATWSAFADIFNQKRSGLKIQAGWELPEKGKLTPREEVVNELYRTLTRYDDTDVFGALLQIPLLEYVSHEHPRVLFVGFGETDEWAHSGRYDLVLRSARENDGFVEQLWKTLQASPEYRDQTTLIITTDHGRGGGLEEWKNHGMGQKGSENIWLAVIGPDTPALGERSNVDPVTQSQIAQTIAALLGKDYRKSFPEAAPALPALAITTK